MKVERAGIAGFILVLLAGAVMLGCVQEKKTEVKFEELKDCQCHQLAYEYPKHVNGMQFCLNCHEIEKHPDVGVKISPENCSNCHETSLFRIHMPNYSCTVCHGDAKSIHEKFESRFVEGAK